MWVRSLGWEDSLEKETVTHSSILAWRIPWTKEPGGLQSIDLQKSRTWPSVWSHSALAELKVSGRGRNLSRMIIWFNPVLVSGKGEIKKANFFFFFWSNCNYASQNSSLKAKETESGWVKHRETMLKFCRWTCKKALGDWDIRLTGRSPGPMSPLFALWMGLLGTALMLLPGRGPVSCSLRATQLDPGSCFQHHSQDAVRLKPPPPPWVPWGLGIIEC